MEMEDVKTLLASAGKKVRITEGRLEVEVPPFENFKILALDGNEYVYGTFVQEKEIDPYIKVRKRFKDKEDGCKYFFLRELADLYVNDCLDQIRKQNKDLDIEGTSTTIEKLEEALAIVGVPLNLFLFNKQPTHKAIVMNKQGNDYVCQLCGEDGQIVHSTIPIELFIALNNSFRKTCLLHLFITEIPKLLHKKSIKMPLTDVEMKQFVVG